MSGKTYTSEMIAEMKRLHAEGLNYAAIARRFGVSDTGARENILSGLCPRILPSGTVCGQRKGRKSDYCARCAGAIHWQKRRQNATTEATRAVTSPCPSGAHYYVLNAASLGTCQHCGVQRQYPVGDNSGWDDHGLGFGALEEALV